MVQQLKALSLFRELQPVPDHVTVVQTADPILYTNLNLKPEADGLGPAPGTRKPQAISDEAGLRTLPTFAAPLTACRVGMRACPLPRRHARLPPALRDGEEAPPSARCYCASAGVQQRPPTPLGVLKTLRSEVQPGVEGTGHPSVTTSEVTAPV